MKTAEERWLEKTYFCPVTGCWIWYGSGDKYGYGHFYDGKFFYTHRWTWERRNGKPPVGMHLDHFVCENPSCCNPDHMRPVSPRENILRSDTPQSRYLARDVCPRCGGEFTQEKDRRRCHNCRNKRNLAYYHKRRSQQRLHDLIGELSASSEKPTGNT